MLGILTANVVLVGIASFRERNKAHTRDEVLLTKLEQAQKEHHSKEEAGQAN